MASILVERNIHQTTATQEKFQLCHLNGKSLRKGGSTDVHTLVQLLVQRHVSGTRRPPTDEGLKPLCLSVLQSSSFLLQPTIHVCLESNVPPRQHDGFVLLSPCRFPNDTELIGKPRTHEYGFSAVRDDDMCSRTGIIVP
mmetsp:Transcript_104884/g.168884  ORF Transcript_104884/g.168884 Transcript_104884/m.168884 type:complete len:140 (+) Transcript_104884:181-600(+)